MFYKPVKDVAEEWGLTVRRVQMMCMDGTIKGAIKEGKLWMVPDDTKKPGDKRVISGAYKKSGKKNDQPGRLYITDNGVDKKFYLALSHDIRTALSSIMGYSDMIKAHIDDRDRIIDYVSNISESGKNIVRLLENTSLLTSIDGNEIVLEEKVFSNTAILHNVIDNFRKDAEYKNIKIDYDFKIIHEFILADEERYKIIFENILNTFLLFSKNDVNIKLTAAESNSSKKGHSKYIYTFEGGTKVFNDSQIAFIKDCFFNKVNVFANSEQTNVIGLIIVKKLVDLMDGHIEIRNDNVSGTNIRLVFDHRLADFASAQVKEKDDIDYSFIRGKSVLLAEDNEINRNMAGRILNEYGVSVDYAEDGIICIAMLEKADAQKYDCVLMDLQMPNMNGFTAASIIRGLADKDKASIPIIAVTASVFNEDREKALKSGMNGFVEKPFVMEELFSVISNCLENR